MSQHFAPLTSRSSPARQHSPLKCGSTARPLASECRETELKLSARSCNYVITRHFLIKSTGAVIFNVDDVFTEKVTGMETHGFRWLARILTCAMRRGHFGASFNAVEGKAPTWNGCMDPSRYRGGSRLLSFLGVAVLLHICGVQVAQATHPSIDFDRTELAQSGYASGSLTLPFDSAVCSLYQLSLQPQLLAQLYQQKQHMRDHMPFRVDFEVLKSALNSGLLIKDVRRLVP